MNELLLCALQRHGKSATAGEIADAAVALASGEGWSRNAFAEVNPRKVAAAMKGLAQRGVVCEDGRRQENGVQRPLWSPASGFNAHAPIPAEPDPVGVAHPLNGHTRYQIFAVCDALESVVLVFGDQRRERNAMFERHERELCAVVARIKQNLLAAGLSQDVI